MAFRRDRRSRSWQDWRDLHRDVLIRCSLPEFVFAEQARWLRFIEHDGWDHETGWNVEMLSSSDAADFINFITDQYGSERYRGLLRVLDLVIESTDSGTPKSQRGLC